MPALFKPESSFETERLIVKNVAQFDPTAIEQLKEDTVNIMILKTLYTLKP